MKRLIILVGLMISASACMAQEDAKKEGNGEWELSIAFTVKSRSSYQVTLPDSVSKEDVKNALSTVFNPKKKYITSVGGFYLGFCNVAGAPSDMNVKLGSSVEIGVQSLFNAKYRPWSSNKRHAFSIGAGFGWKNYRMTGRQCFFKEANGDINICDFADKYPDYGSSKFSRLKIFSWQFPFQYHYNFTKNTTLSLGTIINLNGDGSIKTRYYDTDDDGHRDTFDDIHTNALTVDLLASITYHGWGLYFRYNPCEILDTQYAPKFNTFSIGAILIGW